MNCYLHDYLHSITSSRLNRLQFSYFDHLRYFVNEFKHFKLFYSLIQKVKNLELKLKVAETKLTNLKTVKAYEFLTFKVFILDEFKAKKYAKYESYSA